MTPSFVAKSLERQHLKSVRKYSLQIIDVNTALKDLHQKIALYIDESKYEAATAFVNQYIYHTHIWNIKFMCNFEDQEVALMQIFHLQYIFKQESADWFTNERAIFEEQISKFRAVTLYSDEHIEARRQKMIEFIEDYKK